MAQYKDTGPSRTAWLHELAKAEIHPDAEELLQLKRNFDPGQLVEESTVEVLTQLRAGFEESSRVFNSYSESGSKFQEIKIYAIAQTPADFMLYRNEVKLIVSNSAHGVIQFAYAKHVRGALAVDGQFHAQSQQSPGELPGVSGPQEIIAQVGPFRNVFWTFQGERVTSSQVAKFYFAEFVRATRNTQRSKVGNQLLLDEIKTLLKDKGIEL